ncbi:response regulator [Mariniflexile sp. AS56]|uniref:response regulator n=1 Tax=Mariniflexile sp. AS56 TaxID=3063957 RepID=UPI0026F08755|nr:response regulator [Mariniflexile sp. AS56]MDO7173271.1 response regulator [Mariniflexile sp. AS56]
MSKIDTVCIIDDDPAHVYITKKELKMSGLCETILVYNNGKEAYDRLIDICSNPENLPDLILLDLNMPIWDGWDFLDEFTKIKVEKEILIFIVTSSIDPNDFRRAESYERVSDFIVKPISASKLRVELGKLH